MPQQIRLRNDELADWVLANPVIARGELVVEIDATPPRFKLGDGVTPWLGLPYVLGSGGDSPPVPDASSTVKGVVQLAGDLDGDADAPVLAAAKSAELRTRSNHIGSQPASTIGDFAAAVHATVGRAVRAGMPVGDTAWATARDLQSTAGTARAPHTVAVECVDLRLVYGNWWNRAGSPDFADAPGPAVLTVGAAVEVGGVLYPLTFDGRARATLDPGGWVATDPLPIVLAAGDVIWSRTYVTGGSYRSTRVVYQSVGAGGFTATTDLTVTGSGAIGDGTCAQFAPMALLATPTAAAARAVLVVGDSIVAGEGDNSSFQGRNIDYPNLAGGGWLQRAFRSTIGALNAAFPGDSAVSFRTPAGHRYRLALAGNTRSMLSGYGRNDVSSNRTYAQITTDLVGVWALGAARGMPVAQTTITPSTSSSDSWATVGNQTVSSSSQDTVRVAVNGWLRGGAPLVAGAPAVDGANGAVYAGQAGHPLVAVVDIADLAESARDSGKWKAGYTSDGVHPNPTGAAGIAAGVDLSLIR